MEFTPLNIYKSPINKQDLCIELFFDNNGLELYEELSSKYIFAFSFYNQGALCFSKSDGFIEFLIPQNKPISKALFTHELLHLYLRLNEIDNEQSLRNIIISNSFENILNPSEDNYMYIHNFLDHIIFYNDFKNMGYKDKDFVCDYYENRYSKDIEAFLWYKFQQNLPDNYAIGYYISKYIGLRTPICAIRDYSKAYKDMKKLHPKLYNSCKLFVDKYQLIANEDYDTISKMYNSIIEDFIIDLKSVLL